MSMAGILAWGVPAIQALQDHAEYQSVQTQMLELNQEIRNLRDPQNTRVATLSIAGGQLLFTEGDRWVITGMTEAAYTGYKIEDFDDDDGDLTISGHPVDGTATLEKVVGGKFTSLDEASCTTPTPCALLLGVDGDITTDVLRIQYKAGSIVKAESWIINVGRFTYTQDDTGNQNHLEMGASILEQVRGTFMRQTPTIKEPVFGTTPEDTDFFVRVMHISGTEVAQGRGEFSVLVNLVDNYGVSRGRPLLDPARLVRFQIDGDLEDAFCTHLINTDEDYTYVGTESNCAGGDADVLYDPGRTFTYELSQAQVSGFVRNA